MAVTRNGVAATETEAQRPRHRLSLLQGQSSWALLASPWLVGSNGKGCYDGTYKARLYQYNCTNYSIHSHALFTDCLIGFPNLTVWLQDLRAQCPQTKENIEKFIGHPVPKLYEEFNPYDFDVWSGNMDILDGGIKRLDNK